MTKFISLLLLVPLAVGIACSQPAFDLSDAEGTICVDIEEFHRLQDGYLNGYKDGQAECTPCGDTCFINPTLDELIAWLEIEPAQDCEAVDCQERTENLGESAREKGYDMYCVLLNYTTEGGHALAAFPTTEGVVFVEPWFNKPVVVKIGVDYWRSNFPKLPASPPAIVTDFFVIK